MSEFYEFLPFTFITELGYLIFAYLFWRFIQPRLPHKAIGLVYLLITIQFFLIFMHAWTFNVADIQKHRLWDLNWERNISATFSFVQLALVGSVAINLCWQGKLPRFRRVYLLILGAAYFLFAYDEYYQLHERYQLIRNFYVAFGILFVLLSLTLFSQMSKGPKRAFNLYLWIAAGIACSGFGAFTLEAFSYLCLRPLGWEIRYCLRPYPMEEALENLGTLIVLLGIFIEMKRAIPRARTNRIMETSLFALVIFLISLQSSNGFTGFRLHSNARALQEIPPVEVAFDDGEQLLIDLKGWSMEGAAPPILKPRVSLYMASLIPVKQDFGFSFHLLDAAELNVLSSYHHWIKTPQLEWHPYRVVRESFQLWELDALPVNRAHLLTLAVWKQIDSSGYIDIPISESNQRLLGSSQVVLGEFVIPSPSAHSALADPLAYRFGDDFLLQAVEYPAVAPLGEMLTVTMTWQAVREGTEDWSQFLHFVHEETGELWNHDQEPLGRRLPTRLWYPGLQDTESWQVSVPSDITPGRYIIFTGLYRLSGGVRMPVRDGEGMPLPDAKVPLGYLTITEP
ncbi:MAG: hypothetical protein OXF83_03735 [Anaerolineaceae bacterium]|nr:hypothetical protein [Anaerolineaceae bacterium]